MKKQLQNFLICLTSISTFGSFAQVSITPVTAPATCDAIANLNVGYLSSPNEWFDAAGLTIGTNVTSLNNLCPGNYSVSCAPDTSVITVNYPFTINNFDPCAGFLASNVQTAYTNVDPAICTGEVTISTVGGTAPYTYTLNGVLQPSNIFTNLCQQFYNYDVVDANNCTSANGFYVYTDSSAFNVLNANVYEVDETSPGACDGSAFIPVSYGTPPYSYLFSNGSVSNPATGLCAGLYDVVVSDAAGASITLPFVIASFIFSPSIVDPNVLDTLSAGIYEDCNLVYEELDSAGVLNWSSISADSILVTWYITSPTGTITFTSTILDPNGNGSYGIEVGVYCPVKSVGSFMRIYGIINADNELGVSEFFEISSSVFPNPFKDNVTIEMDESNNYLVDIIDMTGRNVFSQQFIDQSSLSISNLGNLNAGEYLLQIVSDNGISRTKLIK